MWAISCPASGQGRAPWNSYNSDHRSPALAQFDTKTGDEFPAHQGGQGARRQAPANLSNQLGGRAKGNAAMAAKAAERATDLLPLILPMRDGGASLRQIADGLNCCGVAAPRGGDWSAVKRILDRQI